MNTGRPENAPMPAPHVVGRLAPSPTGGLHLGHARTFLIAWWMARKAKGRMILRIEDLDAARVRPGTTEAAITDLRWLGLDWDEGPDVPGAHGPYLQSERRQRYDEALERLGALEQVYPCTCTRAEIARASSAPHAEDEGPRYPGTCASRRARNAGEFAGADFAWRFRVPDAPLTWTDLFRGQQQGNPASSGGDFLVSRAQSGASYQLAVVVDDAAMGVTQVIRGDDLVTSTPRQVLLYRALGWTPPRFGHVPLAVTEDGRRLAKRDQSIKLGTLRERGVDPRWLVGWIAQSCGLATGWTPREPEDLVERFDPALLPDSAWVVREADLHRLLAHDASSA